MSTIRSALRVNGETVPELRDELNNVLARLLGQDKRRWNLEPARKPVRTLTANGTATEGDMVLRVDATAGAIVVALPPAASVKGLTLVVKKVDASANAVAVDADGAETIDGASSASTTTQYDVFRLLSNGTSWDLL